MPPTLIKNQTLRGAPGVSASSHIRLSSRERGFALVLGKAKRKVPCLHGTDGI
jgi:hypothetical protein